MPPPRLHAWRYPAAGIRSSRWGGSAHAGRPRTAPCADRKVSRCGIQLAQPEADVARLAPMKTGWREERHAEAALAIARRLILECLHPGFTHGGTQLLAYGVVAGVGQLMPVGRERRLV